MHPSSVPTSSFVLLPSHDQLVPSLHSPQRPNPLIATSLLVSQIFLLCISQDTLHASSLQSHTVRAKLKSDSLNLKPHLLLSFSIYSTHHTSRFISSLINTRPPSIRHLLASIGIIIIYTASFTLVPPLCGPVFAFLFVASLSLVHSTYSLITSSYSIYETLPSLSFRSLPLFCILSIHCFRRISTHIASHACLHSTHFLF